MSNGIEAITKERDRQGTDLGYTSDHDATHTKAEWVWLIQEQLLRLADPFAGDIVPSKERFIRVGALAAAAIDALSPDTSVDREETE